MTSFNKLWLTVAADNNCCGFINKMATKREEREAKKIISIAVSWMGFTEAHIHVAGESGFICYISTMTEWTAQRSHKSIETVQIDIRSHFEHEKNLRNV